MRQMITRIDDELHARVKAKAEAEGRSVNEFVTELLKAAVDRPESRAERKRRLLAEGKIVSFAPEGPVPTREQLDEVLKGSGTAVSEALDWSRGEW
ncbi:type II toxin-antitoxin system HicB family antitoxin [Amycolatopsis thermalba]|uniref:Type II toxin-antitoxin system HicB family antitoxin n=1 Tax=Amycolatopsis thermalba TaxID=944492 RepID=A0ABY4P416_9PSEU|nr:MULTISPECIES: toxin-antitoxin system HicB family antitoxin [Amycolatopsis]UQS27090.1 type II toxin-antitoxin system HicB family antitoxin [Amycolatopsis thermalba]